MNNKKTLNIFGYVFFGISIASAILACILIYKLNAALNHVENLNLNSEKHQSENVEALKTLNEIQYLIDTYCIYEDTESYYDDLQSAIAYFVHSNDDKYAIYYSPEEYAQEFNKDNGTGCGIAVQVVIAEGEPVEIVRVYEGGPAEKAGILVGDKITKVNELSYTGTDTATFVNSIRGEVGDTLTLEILRDSEYLTLEVIVNEYSYSSISYEEIDDICYIHVESFVDQTDEDFIKSLEDAKSKGFSKFIIDLRNNTGGYLTSVVNMIDYIVPEGTIVDIVDKDNNVVENISSDKSEFTGEFVVITNNKSASASELFAANLQDYNKAIIIGEVTYGKGTVCTEYTLSNGGSLMISTSQYLTPSGNNIEGVGVTPDIEVVADFYDKYSLYNVPIEEDNQLQVAIAELSK